MIRVTVTGKKRKGERIRKNPNLPSLFCSITPYKLPIHTTAPLSLHPNLPLTFIFPLLPPLLPLCLHRLELLFPCLSPSQPWITWSSETQRLPGPTAGHNKWLTALFRYDSQAAWRTSPDGVTHTHINSAKGRYVIIDAMLQMNTGETQSMGFFFSWP